MSCFRMTPDVVIVLSVVVKNRDESYLTVKNDKECDGDKCSKKNCQVGGKSYFKGKGHGSRYRL